MLRTNVTALKEYLKESRTLLRLVQRKGQQRESARLQLLFLLLELKQKDIVWKPEYRTWRELLKKEKLCSLAVFARFEQAVRLLGPQTVQEFGATAASSLAATPTSYRQKLIKIVRNQFEGTNPDHVEVARYVWKERQRLTPPEAKATKPQLRKHIKVLEALLRKHHIEPPVFLN